MTLQVTNPIMTPYQELLTCSPTTINCNLTKLRYEVFFEDEAIERKFASVVYKTCRHVDKLGKQCKCTKNLFHGLCGKHLKIKPRALMKLDIIQAQPIGTSLLTVALRMQKEKKSQETNNDNNL